jgi:hypothetical protein
MPTQIVKIQDFRGLNNAFPEHRIADQQATILTNFEILLRVRVSVA